MSMCPVCGKEVSLLYLKEHAEQKKVIINNEEVVQYKCNRCDTFMTPVQLKHDYVYYCNVAKEKYGSDGRHMLAELDEIKEYGVFDEAKHELAEQRLDKEWDERDRIRKQNRFVPKCPTCGSTNIQQISTASKYIGAALFGIFSKTARSQFKCNSCGYKW